MSKAQLDKFATLVSNDPGVLRDVAHGAQETEQYIRHVVEDAKRRGYDFTEAEAAAWLTERRQLQLARGELQDAELDAVAGGFFPAPPPKTVPMSNGDSAGTAKGTSSGKILK